MDGGGSCWGCDHFVGFHEMVLKKTNPEQALGDPRKKPIPSRRSGIPGGDHELSRDAGYGFDDGWPAR
jgi:hypothetical protein